MADIAELAWAAGFIDGDGSITVGLVNKSQRVPRLQVALSATCLERAALDELERILGGAVRWVNHRTNLGHRPGYWHWILCDGWAVEALELLQPFLVLKGCQAWLAREAFAQQRAQVNEPRFYSPGSPYCNPEEIVALRTGYCQAVSLLNRPERS